MITEILSCSECGSGHYVASGDVAECTTATCEHAVSLSVDVAPWLEEGESLALLSGGVVAVVSPLT